ncbi:MAG: transcription antitermination factor NusB [Coriobacteriia bacterium]|nr:transcription antitermination factor NusB [Coriobacteriia bacterium]
MPIKSGRTKSRTQALQLLFQAEILQEELSALLDQNIYALEEGPLDDFGKDLALGSYEHIDELDQDIARVSEKWDISRMPLVDKNILRIALYEMKFVEDIPVNVSISEAVEIAKAYGGDESSKFINGILGKLALELSDEA